VGRHYNVEMPRDGAIRYSAKSFMMTMIILGCFFIISLPARAQGLADEDSPVKPRESDAAKPTLSTVPVTPAPPEHAFWDRTNLLLFSGIAFTRGMDYASTRNFQARGRQEILLPDDVVNNSAGFASLEAAATMTSIGISYLLHRTGHHTLERWLSIGHIGVTGFGDVRNYALESRHRAASSRP
jgi:hypothetical protein